jgi:tetratricopeptide (TPR) repeat protein
VQADPSYAPLVEGRARAEAALGETAAALRDFARVVSIVPAPSYLVEYGELLQATGDSVGAQQQFALVRTEERLFRANGVALDSDATLFEADHGSPAAAVALGRQAVVTRPFLDSYDAYGWALHRAGSDKAALAMADRALRTGYRNALFRYHRGVIELSLHKVTAGRADLRAALRINPAFSPLAAPIARRLAGTTP